MAGFWTVDDVAARWSCSPRQVRRLCAAAELRAMRVGRRGWRISPDAVAEYELRQTSEPEVVASPDDRRPAAPVVVDGFSLPDDYEPVFPDLWAREAARSTAAPAAGTRPMRVHEAARPSL